jgi:hypothetical protein
VIESFVIDDIVATGATITVDGADQPVTRHQMRETVTELLASAAPGEETDEARPTRIERERDRAFAGMPDADESEPLSRQEKEALDRLRASGTPTGGFG